MPPGEAAAKRDDRAVADAVDRMLAGQPNVDTAASSTALAAICDLRDRTDDPSRRGALNRLVSLVMAVRHPLDAPPWNALIEARAAAFPPSEEIACPN